MMYPIRLITQNKEAAYRLYPAAATWLRGVDLNHRPLGYEPNELPDCSTPRVYFNINSLACGVRRRLLVLWGRWPRCRFVLLGLCRLCRSGNLLGGRLCICRCRFRICG